MPTLLPSQRRDLRARAHHLHPVVAIGHQGLTDAVLHEIDVALKAHELIKVRVSGDDRHEREAIAARVCSALECAPVQHLGKLLVLWRPRPEDAQQARPVTPKKPSERGERAPVKERIRPPASDQSRRRRAPSATPPSGVPRAASVRRRRRTP